MTESDAVGLTEHTPGTRARQHAPDMLVRVAVLGDEEERAESATESRVPARVRTRRQPVFDVASDYMRPHGLFDCTNARGR